MYQKNSKNKSYKKYVILAILCLGSLSACYCQYQMLPLAPEIMEKFHMSQMQYSTVFSASMAPAIILSIIAGMAVDRIGAKQIIFVGLIIATVGLWVRVFTDSYSVLYLCMMLTGIPATFLNSVNAKILARWFTVRQISVAVGIYLAASAVGMALGTGTTAMLPSVTTAFTVAAVLAVITAVFWGLFMQENPKSIGKTKDTSEKHGTERKQKKENVFETLKEILKSRDIILGSIEIMCVFGNYMILSTNLPIALQEKGLTAVSAGSTASIVSLGYFVGCVGTPIIAEKTGGIRRTIFILTLIGTILTALLLKVSSGGFLTMILFVLGVSIGGLLPLFMAFPVRISSIGEQRAGAAGGIISTLQLFGAVVIPSYIAVPISAGNSVRLFWVGTIFHAVACVLTFFMTREIEK